MTNTAEIDKFNQLAHEWWNVNGALRTLHHINPARLEFIKRHTKLQGIKVIDIGCGGGILSESLARAGAIVSAIDLAQQSIEIAKLHLFESNLDIDYQCIDIASIAEQKQQSFDVVVCMELLEHVNDKAEIIANCSKLLKIGGMAFFSTLTKTPKSYLFGVLAAEYLLKLLPNGTHDYNKFITPANLDNLLKQHKLNTIDIKGLDYNPLTHIANITNRINVNYMMCAVRQPD
jgi:2-polyprenyl-6-hydroxyphenyl methylase/3-demethylubiquinone-9 3-methyltransferase